MGPPVDLKKVTITEFKRLKVRGICKSVCSAVFVNLTVVYERIGMVRLLPDKI